MFVCDIGRHVCITGETATASQYCLQEVDGVTGTSKFYWILNQEKSLSYMLQQL